MHFWLASSSAASFSMDAKQYNISKFLSESKQYVAPVYQRNYAWLAEDQCQTLWDDLIDLYTGRSSKHFLGSVVLVTLEDSLSRNFVIDGQQRLTTLMLLTMAFRDFYAERRGNSEYGEDWAKAKPFDVKNLLLLNGVNNKLELNGDDQAIFSKLLRSVPLETFDYTERRSNIYLNYMFFRNCLEQGVNNGVSGLSVKDVVALWGKLRSGFELAVIVLGSADDPQRVFESLNSTGLDLQASDLIRNYVLMSTNGDEELQDNLYNTYWQQFEELFPANDSTKLTDFFLTLLSIKQLLVGTNLAASNALYSTFKRFYPNKDSSKVLGYAEELLHYGVCYARIMGWREELDPAFKSFFADLQWLQGSTRNPLYSLVLFLYYSYDCKKNLSHDEVLAVFRKILSYAVRRAVCTRDSKQLDRFRSIMFHGLGKCNDGNGNLMEQLTLNFSEAVYRHIFPNDEEFELCLKTEDLYNTNAVLRIGRFVLTRLAGLDSSYDAETLKGMTIEHIMPQNENLREEWRQSLGDDWRGIQDLWLHRLGNLTLSFENSELSDKPFTDKVAIYRTSNVPVLNDFICKCQHWTPVEMEARGRVLAQQALHKWSMPDLVDYDELYAKQFKDKSIRKSQQLTLADYCGTSELLLNALKALDEQLSKNLGAGDPEKSGFICSLNTREYIEYIVFPHPVAIVKTDVQLNKVQLWLRCSHDLLPVEQQHAFERSEDISPWHGNEVMLSFNVTADEAEMQHTMRDVYFHLDKALACLNQQLQAGTL